MASRKPVSKPAPSAPEQAPVAGIPAADPLSPPAEAAVKEFVDKIKEGSEHMATTAPAAEQAAQATAAAGTAATEKFQAAFGDLNGRAKAAVEKSSKLMEEMTDLARGNVEALVASSKIAAKGMESLGQGAADYGRRSFEEASAALKSFAEVKSPTDFFRLQSDYVRSAFDSWVSESSKASETVVKLAGDAVEPITSRYSVAVDRVKSATSF